MLRRVRDILPLENLEQIYFSIIQPHLEYCSAVWDNCGTVLQNNLQKLQNIAARIITYSGYEVRSKDLLSHLNWQTLKERWFLHKAVLMYKINNGLAPSYLSRHFKTVNSKHDYNLRGSQINCCTPHPSTNFLKSSIAYNGAVLWNSLPESIRLCATLNSFKASVTSFFT